MEKQWSFDALETAEYTNIRQQVVRTLLSTLRPQLEMESALDLGCGIGHFSRFLADMGLRVAAVDGREENVLEARKRHPDIQFSVRNAEDPGLPEMGTFDFVLCVGLLYHLENPFRTIRNLHALTKKIVVVESMCAPGSHPRMDLLDEGRGEDQGLNYVGFYPTESCLVKMLYRAGFPFVYGFRSLPRCDRFRATLWRKRERTMLVASTIELDGVGLSLQLEINRSWEIWMTALGRWRSRLGPAVSTRRVRRQMCALKSAEKYNREY